MCFALLNSPTPRLSPASKTANQLRIRFYNKTRKPSLRTDVVLLGFLLFVIFSVTLLSVAGRSLTLERFIFSPWGQRYFYTQQLLFVFAIVLYVVRLINWKMLVVRQKIAMLILICSYMAYLNILNTRFYTTSKERGVQTIEFLRLVNEQIIDSENRGKEPRQMVFDRGGGRWDIKINLYNDKKQ